MKFIQQSASLVAIASLLFLASCKKEEGPKGDTGNANVMVFNYGTRTFTGSQSYTIPNISKEVMDNSMVLAYYNPSGENASAWYPVPGTGPSNAYNTRFMVSKEEAGSPDYLFSLKLLSAYTNLSYSTEVTFTKFKIVVAPASSTTNILKPLQNEPDYNDYHAVKTYYGIDE